ncbi:hypothetical protein ACG2F4_10315 [Halalkalibaculum sp. DA3122]|uniref:argonaute/piwi family protein n=1 Tax=Halalkalibaculum sp. DA3122 TaxID=3373607 RepID=UPI00375513D2
MDIDLIDEPELEFGGDTYICPRLGITDYDVFDSNFEDRRSKINVAAVGTAECLEQLDEWLERCKKYIPPKPGNKQPRLYPPFPGFHKDSGFKAELIFTDRLSKRILSGEKDRIVKNEHARQRIKYAVDVYMSKIEFLAENRNPDVIVCILSDDFDGLIDKTVNEEIDENGDEEEQDETLEMNFRRALKSRAMKFRIPLQLVWEKNLTENPSNSQDDATRAWNFCTALYFKASQTVPWRLPQKDQKAVCFVGIGFYRSRDKETLHTSLAQVFDEMGKSVILRGTPVEKSEDDRRPHLTKNDATELLTKALEEYEAAIDHLPARLVLHKSSNYNEDEITGFRAAADEKGIKFVDLITIMDSEFRFLRSKQYPPIRGTKIQLTEDRHILYTRGSVPYYETYPGMYIPQPLEVRIVQSEESSLTICKEIIELTKMNWNDTQFDGKYPITIKCARKVGQIMKYLGEGDRPEISYRFYM